LDNLNNIKKEKLHLYYDLASKLLQRSQLLLNIDEEKDDFN
jgi:hypothetical protein